MKTLLSVGAWVGIIIAIVVVALIVLFVIWYIRTANKLRTMNIECDNANSSIDVALTKRFDTIKKIFQTVKGYAKHERETLESVIGMRQPSATAPMSEKSEFANKLAQAATTISLVVERYPELKADKNFLQMQEQIVEEEENLQAARRNYNSNVSELNKEIVRFPSSIVAKMIKMKQREFFKADEEKRKDVEIEF